MQAGDFLHVPVAGSLFSMCTFSRKSMLQTEKWSLLDRPFGHTDCGRGAIIFSACSIDLRLSVFVTNIESIAGLWRTTHANCCVTEQISPMTCSILSPDPITPLISKVGFHALAKVGIEHAPAGNSVSSLHACKSCYMSTLFAVLVAASVLLSQFTVKVQLLMIDLDTTWLPQMTGVSPV